MQIPLWLGLLTTPWPMIFNVLRASTQGSQPHLEWLLLLPPAQSHPDPRGPADPLALLWSLHSGPHWSNTLFFPLSFPTKSLYCHPMFDFPLFWAFFVSASQCISAGPIQVQDQWSVPPNFWDTSDFTHRVIWVAISVLLSSIFGSGKIRLPPDTYSWSTSHIKPQNSELRASQ